MVVRKSKVKKFLIGLFIVLGILFSFGAKACDNSASNYSIDSMDAKKYTMNVVIDEYGDMHVLETIVIENDKDRYNNYFYKEIMYNKNNMFGNSSANISNLREDARVIVSDNTGVVYDSSSSRVSYPKHFVGFSYNGDFDERGIKLRCESNSYNCDTIFYYNYEGFAKETTISYEYTIEGVITQYNDISELNWVLLDYQPFEFNDVTINITLPEGDYDIREEETFFHGTYMAKRTFVDNNKITITSKDMASDEQIEVRLLLDNELFGSIRNKNKVSIEAREDILAFEEDQIKQAEKKDFVGDVVSLIIYITAILVLIVLSIICYFKYDKEYKSDFYNEYYRELPGEYPPSVMGYLYKFREIDDDDLSASLLDLIRRKYLILDAKGSSGFDDKNPDYTISLNKEKSQNDLTPSEKYLIKWFINEIGDGEKVTTLQLNSYCDNLSGARQYQESSRHWYKLVKSDAKKYNFFEKDKQSVKMIFAVIGFLLSVVCVISLFNISTYSGKSSGALYGVGVIFFVFAYVLYVNGIDKRTKQGNEDYVRWKAFKKFLEDFSSFEDYPVPSIIIWEHYLVYATSFGIADKVSEQLKLKFELEELASQDTTFVIYYGYRHPIGRFNRTVHGMRSTSRATVAKYNASRGSSFGGGSGGGFSGGSSFGGGGGSFGGGRR